MAWDFGATSVCIWTAWIHFSGERGWSTSGIPSYFFVAADFLAIVPTTFVSCSVGMGIRLRIGEHNHIRFCVQKP